MKLGGMELTRAQALDIARGFVKVATQDERYLLMNDLLGAAKKDFLDSDDNEVAGERLTGLLRIERAIEDAACLMRANIEMEEYHAPEA